MLRNVKRWEAGTSEPSHQYRELLAELYGIPADDVVGALLDRRSLVADIRQATDDLCCLYAVRPPAELIPAVHQQLRLIRGLLRDGGRHHHRDLVETAGWLYLLLSALQCGLGRMEPARASQKTALHLGTEVGHAEIVGWSYETASWLSFVDFRWEDMLEAADEGVRRSPPRYSAIVQNTLKVAHARAALGDPAGAERALDATLTLVARMDQTDRPESHFVFDAPKFDKFASEVYADAGMPVKAAYHARISIARSDHPDDPARNHPMRASSARMALASALLDLGELEEACAAASTALKAPFVIEEVVSRVGVLLPRLQARHAKAPAVVALADEYEAARRILPAP